MSDENQTPEFSSRRKARGSTLGGGSTDGETNPSMGADCQTARKIRNPRAASATRCVRFTSTAARRQFAASVACQSAIIHRDGKQSIKRNRLIKRPKLYLVILQLGGCLDDATRI